MQVISVVATPFAVCGLAVSGLGDGRGGMSTFLVYGLVVRGVWVCVRVCACCVPFLVVHGALHEGKHTHPNFSFPCVVPRARYSQCLP